MRFIWLFALPACVPIHFPDLGFDDASIQTEEDLVYWANTASAPNVYGAVYHPWLEQAAEADPACPELQEEGEREVWVGDGCVAEDGTTWDGRMTVERGEGDALDIAYQDLALTREVTCDEVVVRTTTEYSGTIEERPAEGGRTFNAHVFAGVSGGCAAEEEGFMWIYEGQQVDGEESDTWSGHGLVGSTVHGVVTATTQAEVLDEALCETEAVSGETILEAGERTAVVTYDGATDCDPESTATWTLDGEERGEVSGVACATVSPAGWLAALLVLPWIRRRR